MTCKLFLTGKTLHTGTLQLHKNQGLFATNRGFKETLTGSGAHPSRQMHALIFFGMRRFTGWLSPVLLFLGFWISLVNLKRGISLVILVFSLSFPRICGFGRERKSLVILRFSLIKTKKPRKRRTGRNRAGIGNRNRRNRFFPKPKAEPEPPEPFSRNRNRNRNRPLSC